MPYISTTKSIWGTACGYPCRVEFKSYVWEGEPHPAGNCPDFNSENRFHFPSGASSRESWLKDCGHPFTLSPISLEVEFDAAKEAFNQLRTEYSFVNNIDGILHRFEIFPNEIPLSLAYISGEHRCRLNIVVVENNVAIVSSAGEVANPRTDEEAIALGNNYYLSQCIEFDGAGLRTDLSRTTVVNGSVSHFLPKQPNWLRSMAMKFGITEGGYFAGKLVTYELGRNR